MKRLETVEVVDHQGRQHEQVFFGATVTIADAAGGERTLSIVGIDEVDPARGRVSWISPVARALLKTREGDVVNLRTPAGTEQIEVVEIRYESLP
ncbi:MAG: GreA/GreB family elongation factor, partial [Betaproteobacteria bacterium]|nr:GreA/GreB family elongation factor [Betaproteobacteria bacterium]